MKTFALVQGDLSPAPGGYLMVEGASKIHQDLSLALREWYGTDHIHPRWGSTLQRYIGQPLTEDLKAKISREINRVLQNYLTIQNSRIARDTNTGVISTMSTNDVVRAVNGVNIHQVYDSLLVNISLSTASRQTINVNQVLS